jgi:hypothetical protein
MRPVRPALVAVALAALAAAGCGSLDRPTAAETPGGPAATAAATPAADPTATSVSASASKAEPAGQGRTAATRPPASAVPAARPTPTTSALAGRVSDPQVAADRLVEAWLAGDRATADTLAGQAVTDRLFAEPPPTQPPASLPCRLASPGVFVCSYPLAERAELSLFVQGGASAGYRVDGLEFGD